MLGLMKRFVSGVGATIVAGGVFLRSALRLWQTCQRLRRQHTRISFVRAACFVILPARQVSYAADLALHEGCSAYKCP
jgi:hypothetical protein